MLEQSSVMNGVAYLKARLPNDFHLIQPRSKGTVLV